MVAGSDILLENALSYIYKARRYVLIYCIAIKVIRDQREYSELALQDLGLIRL